MASIGSLVMERPQIGFLWPGIESKNAHGLVINFVYVRKKEAKWEGLYKMAVRLELKNMILAIFVLCCLEGFALVSYLSRTGL